MHLLKIIFAAVVAHGTLGGHDVFAGAPYVCRLIQTDGTWVLGKGSGVLVAPDLILTARHNFAGQSQATELHIQGGGRVVAINYEPLRNLEQTGPDAILIRVPPNTYPAPPWQFARTGAEWEQLWRESSLIIAAGFGGERRRSWGEYYGPPWAIPLDNELNDLNLVSSLSRRNALVPGDSGGALIGDGGSTPILFGTVIRGRPSVCARGMPLRDRFKYVRRSGRLAFSPSRIGFVRYTLDDPPERIDVQFCEGYLASVAD